MAITSPKDIPGLILWWSAEAQSSRFADGEAISDRIWDSSGNNFHGLVKIPGITYEATTGPAGGPALNFAGGYAEVWRAYLNALKDATAGEIMATIQNEMLQTDTTQGGPWKFGTDTNGSLYVYNGTLYEQFASTARKSGAVVDDTTLWNRYNVWSAANDFAANINGVARITSGTNTVSWNTVPIIGSNGSTTFHGRFGCIVMYSKKLTATERADLDAWLQANPSGGDAGSALPPPDPWQSIPQYVRMNVGVKNTGDPDGVQYVRMNVGVKYTPSSAGVQYSRYNVIDPPSTLFLSDGKDWRQVVLHNELDTELKKAKTDSELFAGALVSQQGMPSGGKTGQVLKKISDDNYDAKWATETGGGGGGIPAGGATGDALVKGSALDGDASWGKIALDHISEVNLTTPPTDGQVLKYDAASKKWKPSPDLTSSSSGSGGKSFPIDSAPASPSTMDDEFDGTTLNSKWTLTAPTGVTPVVAVEDGMCVFKPAITTGWAVQALTQPLPASGDWEFTLAVAGMEAHAQDYHVPAMIGLSEGASGATGQVQNIMLGSYAVAVNRVECGKLSSWTAWVGGLPRQDNAHSGDGYLRVSKVGTTYSFSFSRTGKRFRALWSGTIAWTPGRVFIGGKTEGGATGMEPIGLFKWFRKTV